MDDQEQSANQLALLTQHRRRLNYQLRRQARLGDATPPEVAFDIEDIQATIQVLKLALRASGLVVDDLPEDTAHVFISTTRLAPVEQRNRATMLQKIDTIWIKGLLEQSLAEEIRITLDLEERPEAVRLPLNVQVQELRRPNRMLPSGTAIVDVFDDLGGELLILGAPGAGKTIMLLELARDLLDRANHDDSHPIPVVFNLSSWAAKCPPLAAWLMDELNTVYDVPRKVARAWVGDDMLLPLLDGLDEVHADHRTACVGAINTFRREHGAVDIAICSRDADYRAIGSKLKLQGAVLIQPLTVRQIASYLERTGDRLTALKIALEADTTLRELAESPLLLAIMTLAYQDEPIDVPLEHNAVDLHRTQLFAAYVDRMFARRRADTRYQQQQTIRWLTWMARALQQQAQTVFFLERLQPDWLPTRAARWQYTLADRLCGALGAGLLGTALFGLLGRLVFGLANPLGVALVFGLAGAMVGGLFGGVDTRQAGLRQGIWQTARSAILGGLVGWLIFGLAFESVDVQGFRPIGILSGALAGALAGGPSLRARQIAIVETLRWSPSKALRSGCAGLVVGLIFGLATLVVMLGLGRAQSFGDVLGGLLALGLGGGLIGGILGGLLGGLITGELEAKVTPNQGIRRSALDGLAGGLAGGLVVVLVLGLVVALVGALAGTPGAGLQMGLGLGLSMGLGVALVGALAYGGYACLSHLTLRLILWRCGAMPLNYVRFLDYCAERIFLRKVGGGYIFVHRLLLEHFASLVDGTTKAP